MSLVELMVALALGLILALVVGGIYLSTKGNFSRQNQIGSLQKKARMAFETLVFDTRMVGYQGCSTGKGSIENKLSTDKELAGAYALGVQGYDYSEMTDKFTSSYNLTKTDPDNVTDAGYWHDIIDTDALAIIQATIPISKINDDGLTPGSDVLVIRGIAGDPLRLNSGNISPGEKILTLSSSTPSSPNNRGYCFNKTLTKKYLGLCINSHVLVSSCTAALVTDIEAMPPIGDNNFTISGPSTTSPFTAIDTEVFPLKTVVYYVKRSPDSRWPSLYRKIFDGQDDNGIEQELIEGVESMHIRYGVDTDDPADGNINGEYVTADKVQKWNNVLAIRMSLWLRTQDEVRGDLPLSGSGTANGTTIVYPSSRHERRTFTTTVALRNRIELTDPPTTP